MRVVELMESAVSATRVYYHGTNENFENFDIEAKRINRGTNVTGVYFTPFEREALTFGSRIIRANLKVVNPFYTGKKNKVTKKMLEVAGEMLRKHTNHAERWIETALLPDFEEKGTLNIFSGMSGDVKRAILIAGGYDAYIDGAHLPNAHVVILEPSKRNIKTL